MQTITRTDIHPIVNATLASDHKVLDGRTQFKTLKVVYDLDTGNTTFFVEAQFQPDGINSWRTVNKSYTILETAIVKYNELQF